MEIEDNLKMYFEHKIDSVDRNIDVEKAVMSEIASPKRRTYNKEILAFMVMIAICMASTGIVYGKEIVKYLKSMDFMNVQGEVEWSVNTDIDNSVDFGDETRRVLNNLDLEEGKAVAIYVVEDNPENGIILIGEPITVQDIDSINSYLIGTFNVALEQDILDTYYYKDSIVTLELGAFNAHHKMIEEARKTGNNVIIYDIETTDKVNSTVSNYYKNGSNPKEAPYFTVEIMRYHGTEVVKSSFFLDELVDFETIMIGDSEVLYENYIDSNQVEWISDKIYYRIYSLEESMTMDELIKIAEHIKMK